LQLPVASVIAVTRTWEELRDLPETTYKYKERKRDDYNIAFIFWVEEKAMKKSARSRRKAKRVWFSLLN
jgi:hypothetical protein